MTTKLIGNDDGTYSATLIKNLLFFQSFTASATGTLSEIRLKSSGSGNAKVGIYSNSSSAPSGLLASTASTAIAAGWNTVSVADVSITSGTVYWLAVVVDTNTTEQINYTGGTSKYKSVTYTNSLPDPAGTVNSVSYNVAIAGWGTEAAGGAVIPLFMNQYRQRRR